MKTILLSILLFFLLFPAFGQKPFAFEKTDSLKKSKTEIYSLTKMFITDYWKSANNVIQNDDKETGVIQVKGLISLSYSVGMGLKCQYEYDYAVTFRQKDNKYKIEVYNVICISAFQTGLGSQIEVPLIQPFEVEPGKTQSFGKGLSKKKAIVMMDDLKVQLNNIIASYSGYLIKHASSDF